MYLQEVRAESMRPWNTGSTLTEEVSSGAMLMGGIQEHNNCIIFLIAWLWYIYSHTIQLTHLQYKVQWLSVLYRVMHPWTKSDLWSKLSDNLPCVCILICVMCVDPGACVHVHVTSLGIARTNFFFFLTNILIWRYSLEFHISCIEKSHMSLFQVKNDLQC